MSEMKSAWEIAQEKIEKLGKLSAEELRRQKQERVTSTGKALAEGYLAKPDPAELTEALNKHKNEPEIVRAVLSQLVKAIDPLNGNRRKDISKGIVALSQTERTATTIERIEELFDEYRQAEQKIRQQIEREGSEILHQVRISGSAISEINPRAKEEWQRTLDRLCQPFEERLNNLKEELIKRLPE